MGDENVDKTLNKMQLLECLKKILDENEFGDNDIAASKYCFAFDLITEIEFGTFDNK